MRLRCLTKRLNGVTSFFICAAIFVLSQIVCSGVSEAKGVYVIDPQRSRIEGSIGYSLIGHYKAKFEDFSGTIEFDPLDIPGASVSLKIRTQSIKSKFPVLDKIVCSPRLLDAKKYPFITFKGGSIHKKQGSYRVDGTMSLHGVSRNASFPFFVEGPFEGRNQKKYLKAHGKWIVNRKDFDVIWHHLFDKGGIVVGDKIIVEWAIVADEK